jgi:glutaredoxin 2
MLQTDEMFPPIDISHSLPILYSFRRCPYAMRARLAIWSAGLNVVIREVDLKQKPAALLAISAKATVPVLQLATGEVLAESLDLCIGRYVNKILRAGWMLVSWKTLQA